MKQFTSASAKKKQIAFMFSLKDFRRSVRDCDSWLRSLVHPAAQFSSWNTIWRQGPLRCNRGQEWQSMRNTVWSKLGLKMDLDFATELMKKNENKLWILIRVKYDMFVIIIRFPLLHSFPPQLSELNGKQTAVSVVLTLHLYWYKFSLQRTRV